MRPSFLCPLATAALLLLAGCQAAEAPTLRVGINAWPGYEFLNLAEELGYYQEAGLEVRIVEFGSLSDCRRAFERGQIDVMGTSVVEVLMARANSTRSPEIVRVADYSNGADVIVARTAPGAEPNAQPALRGARIGVEIDSLGIYVLDRGLRKFGLTLADVQLVPMDQTSMEAGLRTGELMAAVSYPPATLSLLETPGAQTIFTTAEIPGEVVDVIAVEAEWSREHPEIVKKVLDATDRAMQYTTEHPVEAYTIMAGREHISVEDFRIAITHGIVLLRAADQDDFFGPAGKLQKVVVNTDRVLRENGQLKGPDTQAGLVNDRFNAAPPAR